MRLQEIVDNTKRDNGWRSAYIRSQEDWSWGCQPSSLSSNWQGKWGERGEYCIPPGFLLKAGGIWWRLSRERNYSEHTVLSRMGWGERYPLRSPSQSWRSGRVSFLVWLCEKPHISGSFIVNLCYSLSLFYCIHELFMLIPACPLLYILSFVLCSTLVSI